jgi:hypothetical protein
MSTYLAAFCLEVSVPDCANENVFYAFTRYSSNRGLPLQVTSSDHQMKRMHVPDIRRAQFRVDLTCQFCIYISARHQSPVVELSDMTDM